MGTRPPYIDDEAGSPSWSQHRGTTVRRTWLIQSMVAAKYAYPPRASIM